ncbi:MAG: vWA domain-containing protein [Pseudomonadota bacterium]
MDYPTLFGGMLGVDTMEETLVSEVTIGNRTVEIALVLDNSGSMGGSRLSTLKTESQALVDTVFNASQLSTIPDPVRFSVVPFAGTVNIGTGNRDRNWMDRRGWSPVHHENFDWENTYRSNNQTRVRRTQGFNFGFQERIDGSWRWKTRHDVFEMLGTEWAGCVEMRPWPHNVMDTFALTNRGYRRVRDSVDADGDGVGDGTSALFVPYFAPDEPDHNFAERPANFTDLNIAPGTDHDGDDDYYRNNYLYDFQDYNPSSPSQRIQLYTDFNPSHENQARISPEGANNQPQRGSNSQINRTNWLFKYQRNQQYRGGLSNYHGPNDGCTVRPMTELSTDREQVKAELRAMQATGTTNIQQGLTWGWRVLSPTEPFAGGRAYDDRFNMKFIVLLSDGNNFYSSDGDATPNRTAYGAWGYARQDNVLPNALNGEETHNRWLDGLDEQLAGTIYQGVAFPTDPDDSNDFEKIMNAHTLQACNNIKNAGVSIFTVAFNVPSSGGVRQLLEACSGSGILEGQPVMTTANFYHDVQGDQLKTAFESIARQIANLHVSG